MDIHWVPPDSLCISMWSKLGRNALVLLPPAVGSPTHPKGEPMPQGTISLILSLNKKSLSSKGNNNPALPNLL